MRRTVDNIKDPLFRFFEREVNAGINLLAQVRRDMREVMLICQGEKKPTNHHRTLISELTKGKLNNHSMVSLRYSSHTDEGTPPKVSLH